MNDEQTAKAHAEKLGISMDDVRKGWAKLAPLVRVAAKISPNKVDDALVAFLDSILATTN